MIFYGKNYMMQQQSENTVIKLFTKNNNDFFNDLIKELNEQKEILIADTGLEENEKIDIINNNLNLIFNFDTVLLRKEEHKEPLYYFYFEHTLQKDTQYYKIEISYTLNKNELNLEYISLNGYSKTDGFPFFVAYKDFIKLHNNNSIFEYSASNKAVNKIYCLNKVNNSENYAALIDSTSWQDILLYLCGVELSKEKMDGIEIENDLNLKKNTLLKKINLDNILKVFHLDNYNLINH